MRAFEFGPEEVENKQNVGEQDNQDAALEALIDYAIECAMDARLLIADERKDTVKQNLCSVVL